MKKVNRKKGFTLIELIVVIAIIGILAAIAIPRLSGFQKSAKLKADIASARTLATAAATFYAQDPTHNYIATSGSSYTTSDAFITAIDEFLPQNNTGGTAFVNKTQLDGSAFVLTVSADGDITVSAGSSGATKLYPTFPSTVPSDGDY